MYFWRMIAQDTSGERGMAAWAIHETHMLVEKIIDDDGTSGWTVTWKGRGWDKPFSRYLRLLRAAIPIGLEHEMPISASVPPSATDGKRVYLNWLGIGFAVDAQTGKLLWRTRKFSELSNMAQQFVYGGINIGRYHLALADLRAARDELSPVPDPVRVREGPLFNEVFGDRHHREDAGCQKRQGSDGHRQPDE